jgi:gliding motility-associated-like protein
VYEEPRNIPHEPYEHPRFIAQLIDPVTNTADICANFDFNSSDPTGFLVSPIRTPRAIVLYKPWDRVYINLSKYPPGKEVYLEFSTADCTLGGHWGYAYVDVEGCKFAALAENSCNKNETILSAQSGFSTYNWWNKDYTRKYGAGQNLTISPALQVNDVVNLEFSIKSFSGCKDTAKIIVTKKPDPLLDLGQDQTICVGASVNIGVSALSNLNYSWTSSAPISNPNLSTISVSPSTDTKYYLTVTDKLTGCSAKDSIFIFVKPKPVISVNSGSICVGDSITLTASGATKYSWSPVSGIKPVTNGDSSIVRVSPAVTTLYTITGLPDQSGCGGTTTSTITVKPLPVLNVNSGSICPNESITLTASGASTYSWSPTSGINSASGSDSSTVTASPSNNTTYTVKGSPDQNGCRGNANATVNILPSPSVELGADKRICDGAPPVIIGVSALNNLSYSWTSSAPISNPNLSQISVAPTSDTKYYLKVTESQTGCPGIDSIMVFVTPPPVLNVNSVAICPGKTAVLNVSGAGKYNWSPAPLSASKTDSSSVTVSPLKTTEYTITGIQIPSGCSSKIRTTVTVNPNPVPNISITGNNNFICEGSSVILNASGGQTYQWFLNNNPIPGATASILSSDKPGDYSLKAISDKGCDTMTKLPITLPVIPKPIADFTAPWGCELKSVRFNNNSSAALQGGVSWKWEFGDGNSSNEKDPTYIYKEGENYQVKLTVVPQLCPQNTVSITRSVLISKGLSGLRYPTINTTKFKPTPLTARPGATQYLWSPVSGLSNPRTQSPIFNYDSQTEYLININNQDGCNAVDTLLVKLFNEEDIFVPEAFTPNGDGVNDYLDVFLIGIKEIRFWVFNRWGQLMFETTDPAQRWDGIYAGKKQPLENYVWIAEAITISGKKIKKRGQTILIR